MHMIYVLFFSILFVIVYMIEYKMYVKLVCIWDIILCTLYALFLYPLKHGYIMHIYIYIC